jgi:hypothetical protein
MSNGEDKLLAWLEKNITEQRAVGLQPVTIVVLSSALIFALWWCWKHV